MAQNTAPPRAEAKTVEAIRRPRRRESVPAANGMEAPSAAYSLVIRNRSESHQIPNPPGVSRPAEEGPVRAGDTQEQCQQPGGAHGAHQQQPTFEECLYCPSGGTFRFSNSHAGMPTVFRRKWNAASALIRRPWMAPRRTRG